MVVNWLHPTVFDLLNTIESLFYEDYQIVRGKCANKKMYSIKKGNAITVAFPFLFYLMISIRPFRMEKSSLSFKYLMVLIPHLMHRGRLLNFSIDVHRSSCPA